MVVFDNAFGLLVKLNAPCLVLPYDSKLVTARTGFLARLALAKMVQPLIFYRQLLDSMLSLKYLKVQIGYRIDYSRPELALHLVENRQ